MDDAQLLNAPVERSLLGLFLPPVQDAMIIKRAVSLAKLDSEAPAVLARAKAAAPTSMEAHVLFDHFVHDSLAGFDHHALELTGYWRYRKGFLGSPKRLIAENDSVPDTDQISATG